MIELVKIKGKLYVQQKGREDVELKAESSTRFFYTNKSDNQLEFKLDRNGKVVQSFLITHGVKKR